MTPSEKAMAFLAKNVREAQEKDRRIMEEYYREEKRRREEAKRKAK